MRPLPPQYYKLKRFEADSSGQCSFAPENYRISHRDPPDFIFRMQLSPDFELLAASFSPALNAFVSLHWHGASENCSHPDVVNFDAQICSPKQWAALDGNSYRTAISVYFPDKMALCFASGRELLAVPRSQGTLVMVFYQFFTFHVFFLTQI